jgi:mono/diheme cytochrome c family protein
MNGKRMRRWNEPRSGLRGRHGLAAFLPCPGPKRPHQPGVVHRGPRVLTLARAATIVLSILAVIGFRSSLSARAEDFDAGKSAQQLFASNCSSCHHTAHGLARRMSSWSLNAFLREHYTATRASADTLSTYLLAEGGGIHVRAATRSEVVAPAISRRKRSMPRPPADIPNH